VSDEVHAGHTADDGLYEPLIEWVSEMLAGRAGRARCMGAIPRCPRAGRAGTSLGKDQPLGISPLPPLLSEILHHLHLPLSLYTDLVDLVT
jgi:hypothetical protein